jgi:prolyl oligopeptidase
MPRTFTARLLAGLFCVSAASGALLAQDNPVGFARVDADRQWLDDGYSQRALDWVAGENDKTLDVLRKGDTFSKLQKQAETILTDETRLPLPEFIGGAVYNYWQSKARPLGIWRRTSKESYFSGKPVWEAVLDFDALSAAEGRKWIFAGAQCRGEHCLVRLSDNGKDAGETREFDLSTKSFVAGGFRIPESKSRAWWYDDDTLLVAPAFGAAGVNKAGYPNSLRFFRRGAEKPDRQELFTVGDWDANIGAMFVNTPGIDGFVGMRRINAQVGEYFVIKKDGTKFALPLPGEMRPSGVYGDRMLLRLNQDWKPAGASAEYKSGDLVAISLSGLLQDQRIRKDELLFRPGRNEAVRDVTSDGTRFYLELLRDYRSAVVELTPAGPTWSARTLPLAKDSFIQFHGVHDGKLLLHVESLLAPERLMLADPQNGDGQDLYRRAPGFDSSRLVTELLHTKSRDGTHIAYTILHSRNMKLDGSNPTLVYGYGGYDVSITPRYEPLFGKLWLEQGGVYVHAYIRGGGENGPEWHKGAMRKNRQQPYDDMSAILEDLQRRKITAPKHTGILGRSNGGLMVAAMLVQRPDLMNAAIVGGPLTDMLHFHELPPGSSWLAEYGDPRDPDARSFLATYSPLQKLKRGAGYPVPLVITSTDDDRVLPGHARRFAARMHDLGHRAFYFEDRQGGHYWELSGGPAPGDWRLRAVARAVEFTYLWQRLGAPNQPVP